MIGVKKIAHATYETPDLDQQVEYYTDILGLTLARARTRTLPISPRPSTIIRWCCAKAARHNACGSAFRSGPTTTSNEFEKQTAAHGIKTKRKKDPEPTIADMVVFEDPKGTVMEVFKRGEFSHQKFPTKGIVPHKLGHVAFHRHRRQAHHEVLLRRARLPRVRLDGRISSRSCAAASTTTPST